MKRESSAFDRPCPALLQDGFAPRVCLSDPGWTIAGKSHATSCRSLGNWGPSAGQPGEGLSRREQEILDQLLRGIANKEIADHLSISVFTVKNHLVHIYERLHVRCRTDVLLKYRDTPSKPGAECGLRVPWSVGGCPAEEVPALWRPLREACALWSVLRRLTSTPCIPPK